jgi:hypothetical protein
MLREEYSSKKDKSNFTSRIYTTRKDATDPKKERETGKLTLEQTLEFEKTHT